MKASKRNIFILLVLIAIMSIPIIAEAGVFDWFGGAKDFVFDHMISGIITIVFGIIGTFYATTKIGKILMKGRVAIEGLFHILKLVRKAKSADSPGGVNMTDKEKKQIWDKIEEIIVDTLKSATGKDII